VGLAHDGSLGYAHAFIDGVARAGADAVKFQTHIAIAESTPSEPFRVKFSRQDASRFDYWKRMEFTEAQWKGLADHSRDVGLVFLSSPFSVDAVELLTRVGMAMWKVPSGEIGSVALLDAMIATGSPILLSSGMSDMRELDAAVQRVRAAGADVVEVHVTMSRGMFGPDVPASVTTEELRQLVDGIRFIERMRASPVDKDRMAAEMTSLRSIFTKSLVAKSPLSAGTVLTEGHLAMKKPGTGIPAGRISEVVGRRLRRNLDTDEQLHLEDLER
jgi:N-acetylneuraminate synthase